MNLSMKHTQKSCCSFSRWAKSSNGIVQLATKSSGGIAASWNTVKPIFFALVTSWMNDSFHDGSNVFDLVVERSAGRQKERERERRKINIRKLIELFEWIFLLQMNESIIIVVKWMYVVCTFVSMSIKRRDLNVYSYFR